MLRKQISFIILMVSFVQLYAQTSLQFTMKEGLPTNHIYDVVEDANGYMWFATKEGIVKYDSEIFKVITIQDGLPNNDTWELNTDYKGNVWYFSKSSSQGYVSKDSLHNFSTQDGSVTVPYFIYKSKDSLWFFHDGIKTFDDDKIVDCGLDIPKLNNLFRALRKKYKLTTREIYLINPETREVVFMNMIPNKLLVYDWNIAFKHTLPLESIEEKLEIRSFVNANGLLYNQIGYMALKKGMLLVDFSQKFSKFITYQELFNQEEIDNFKLKSTPHKIQLSTQGKLVVLDYQFNKLASYSFSEGLGKHGYQDSRGHIWLVDNSKGVSMLKNTQLTSKVFFSNKKVQKVLGINNEIYVGVDGDGFYKLDETKINSEVLLTQPLPHVRNHSQIYEIYEDTISKESLFVSNNQIYYLNKSQLKAFNLQQIPNEVFYFNGTKFLYHFKGSYYLITSKLIYKLKEDEQLTHFSDLSGFICATKFNHELYFAGSGGLFKLNNQNIEKVDGQHKLLEIPIRTLFATKDYLYVGTDGRGIYLYHQDKVYHIKSTDGLSINRIILEQNMMWLATQKGVKKIQLDAAALEESKIIDAFYESDGILQDNINDIYKKGDFLYVASDLGLSKINIENPLFKKTPQIYFKYTKDTLHIDQNTNNTINIKFGLLDYVNQKNVRYAYRLLPIQDEWTPTDNKSLNFANLSPAIYQVEVRAIDQHDNKAVARLYLNIIPLWYQTIIAKVVFGLAIIGVLYLIFTLLKINFRNKEEKKFIYRKRVSSLELLALRSQMNPHFVHNSLNAIQYFIQRNEVELSENYLSKFSKLIRLFFEYSRRKTVSIHEEIGLLNHYLVIEKLRFEDKLNYEIIVSDKIDEHEQMIPSMILQPIVENAVNHGLFHKKEVGMVEIHFNYVSPMAYEVTVIDDGIGIKKSSLLHKVSSAKNQSNSTHVLIERLELLNKGNEWNIHYQIKDRSELDPDKTGTIVRLTIHQKTKE